MNQISPEVIQYLITAPATILVSPDDPKFTILYANPAYHQATLTSPDDIIGLGFLEAFPESPEDPEGDNVYVLRTSLTQCVLTKKRVELPGKRYDIPIRGTDKFETKYWQASNNPVFNQSGEIVYISHVTVEITGAYDLAKKERIAREVTEAKRRDLHSLLMEAPAAITILDGPDFIYEFQNAMHRRLFPDRDLLGKGLTDAFPELKDSYILPILRGVFEKGETYVQKEVRISPDLQKNGPLEGLFWTFIYKPRYSSSNEIDGIIVFGYDVTGHVTSRQKVEESEKRLQTILETMAEGIGIVNSEGEIIYANPMAEKLLGLNKEEIIQRSYYDTRWKNLRVDGTPLQRDEHPIYISMETGEAVFDHEIGVQPPDAEPVFISINAAPLKDEDGKVTGAVGTFMDVTQRRKTAQLKDEFISTVSHELKTPVTSIKAYLQLLTRSLSGYDNVDTRRSLGRLAVQVNRLESLIRDFLDVTRIDSGKMVLKATKFDISIVLTDLINDLQLLTSTHKLLITQSEPITVSADQNRVVQVLTNLITNAVKYSPGADKVLITLRKDENNMVCSVKDFGVGIPQSHQKLVFNRFHQAGNTYKGAGLSLGLGLYISKEIVEKGGGEIWLDSMPGEGSTFFFSIPL